MAFLVKFLAATCLFHKQETAFSTNRRTREKLFIPLASCVLLTFCVGLLFRETEGKCAPRRHNLSLAVEYMRQKTSSSNDAMIRAEETLETGMKNDRMARSFTSHLKLVTQ